VRDSAAQVWRAAAFEFVATFVLVFVGTLCTISSLESGFQHPVLAIAIFQSLVLSLCILAAAPMSGGHVNPCITWTEMLTGHITPVRALLYIAAQALGSIIASLAVKKIVGDAVARKYMLGGCYLHSQVSATSGVVGLEPGRAFLLEIVLSFFVLLIAYSVALDPQRLPATGPRLAPFLIGGLIGLSIFAGGSLVPGYSGAGVNPGRCLGPAVALGAPLWTGHWVFWAGPAVAGLALNTLYRTVPPSHLQDYERRRNAAVLVT
jgi:aquaporin-4